MKTKWMSLSSALFVAIFFMTSQAAAQNVSSAELQFKDALHKQQVEGDLDGAVKLYDAIIAKTTDRVVKAKALLQLATAYDTLGKQSQALYEQIVRDFGDQPAATQARTRLASLRQPMQSTMTMRKIDLGYGIQNIVTTDGQKAVYWDSQQTALYISDIKGNDKRVIFEVTERVPEVFVSRDLSTVFLYFPGVTPSAEPRYGVVKTDRTGYREFSPVENGRETPRLLPLGLTWSWDNRYLAMYTPGGPNGLRLIKIAVSDGRVQELLKDLPPTGKLPPRFSPDDRFIAYSQEGAVYVIPSQGGLPQLIAERRSTVGDWSRDGRFLIIQEDVDNRPPKMWAVPIQNGRAAGERVAIASNIELPETHVNGAMIIKTGGERQRLQVMHATFDPEGRLGPWKPLNLNDGGTHPDWSPDSQQVVYSAGSDRRAVRVHNLASGEDHEVHRSAEGAITNCLWAQTKPRLFCLQGRREPNWASIVSKELDSGRVETIGSFQRFMFLLRVSPDDRSLIIGAVNAAQWNIGDDPETTKAVPRYETPDGRWALRMGVSGGGRLIMIGSASGENDDLRLLVQTRMQPFDGAPSPIGFTPDSRWVIYQDKGSAGNDGLYRIPVSGGTPERIGDYPTSENSGQFSISPDGRQILTEVRMPPTPPEFWALDNVVPLAASSTKPKSKAPAK